MTDNKMSDAEIIKALPTVAYGGHSCNECKYKHEKGECRCGLKGCRITREALDLINRQKAEIERLNVELVGMRGACESYKIHYDNAQAEIERLRKGTSQTIESIRKLARDTIRDAKSEAYKEFAERLCKDRVSNDPVVIAVKVELEELTEAGNGDGMG